MLIVAALVLIIPIPKIEQVYCIQMVGSDCKPYTLAWGKPLIARLFGLGESDDITNPDIINPVEIPTTVPTATSAPQVYDNAPLDGFVYLRNYYPNRYEGYGYGLECSKNYNPSYPILVRSLVDPVGFDKPQKLVVKELRDKLFRATCDLFSIVTTPPNSSKVLLRISYSGSDARSLVILDVTTGSYEELWHIRRLVTDDVVVQKCVDSGPFRETNQTWRYEVFACPVSKDDDTQALYAYDLVTAKVTLLHKFNSGEKICTGSEFTINAFEPALVYTEPGDVQLAICGKETNLKLRDQIFQLPE